MSLSRPAIAAVAEQQRRARRRGCSRPAPTRHRVGHPRRLVEEARRRRGPSPRPAPGRTATAPSSARRWSARRRRCAGSRRASAWPSSFDPGSVIATKWRAASAAPTDRRRRGRRSTAGRRSARACCPTCWRRSPACDRGRRGSRARRPARDRSSRARAARGAPGWRPNVRPAPRDTGSSRPCRAAARP